MKDNINPHITRQIFLDQFVEIVTEYIDEHTANKILDQLNDNYQKGDVLFEYENNGFGYAMFRKGNLVIQFKLQSTN